MNIETMLKLEAFTNYVKPFMFVVGILVYAFLITTVYSMNKRLIVAEVQVHEAHGLSSSVDGRLKYIESALGIRSNEVQPNFGCEDWPDWLPKPPDWLNPCLPSSAESCANCDSAEDTGWML